MATVTQYQHYDADSFSSVTSDSSNFFSFYHLNARSLKSKEDELTIFLSSIKHDFDVLAFSETWFSNGGEAVQLEGYKLESLFRKDKRGGGVALYIKNTFVYDVIPEYTTVNPNCESLFMKTSQFVVGVIYRPPSGSLEEFYRVFEVMLEGLSALKKAL